MILVQISTTIRYKIFYSGSWSLSQIHSTHTTKWRGFEIAGCLKAKLARDSMIFLMKLFFVAPESEGKIEKAQRISWPNIDKSFIFSFFEKVHGHKLAVILKVQSLLCEVS